MRDCFDAESIGDVAHLAEEDPRRRHVRECERCYALLLSYTDFLAAQPREEERAAVDEANQRLQRFLQEKVVQETTIGVGARRESSDSRTGRGILSFLLGPRSLALAALILLAWGLSSWPGRVREGTPALRGSSVRSSFECRDAVFLDSGRLQLRWTALRGAGAYEVRLLASDLTEVERLPAGPDTLLILDVREIRQIAGSRELSDRTFYWRVIAFEHGDEIGSTPPASFDLP